MLIWLFACSSSPPAPPPPAAQDGDGAALDVATAAGRAFGAELRSRMKAALDAGGPPEGVRVCNEAAPGLATTFGAEHGVTVGRASLRTRNPANVGPTWVQDWLRAQGERGASGVEPLREVVDTPFGRMARVALPIAVEPACLTCHGPVDTLPEPVRGELAARYPGDTAVGYAIGDLRGATWVERRVAAP